MKMTHYEIHREDAGVWLYVESHGDEQTAANKATQLQALTYFKYRVMRITKEREVVWPAASDGEGKEQR